MAIRSTDNHRKLRSQGIKICKTADVIIATFCSANKLPLLHYEKDFHPFAQYLGLEVLDASSKSDRTVVKQDAIAFER